MTPALKGESVARPVGEIVQRQTASQGEVVVTCDRPDCGWSTVRPEYAADSARRAHQIRHQKGMA